MHPEHTDEARRIWTGIIRFLDAYAARRVPLAQLSSEIGGGLNVLRELDAPCLEEMTAEWTTLEVCLGEAFEEGLDGFRPLDADIEYVTQAAANLHTLAEKALTENPEMLSIGTLTRNWTLDDYQTLLALANSECVSFILVEQSAGSSTTPILRDLAPDTINTMEGNRWPGRPSEQKSTACVTRVALTPRSRQILSQAAKSLWDWKAPSLPENLSFLREDGRPYFISVTREKRAWFRANAADLALLQEIFFDDAFRVDGFDENPGERY